MIPNIITSLRILLLFPLFGLLATGALEWRWAALACFLLAGLTDVLDGWLARKLNQTSALGAILDLIADRLLTLAAVAGLMLAGGLGPLAAVAGVVLLVRDIVVSALNEALPGKLAIRVSMLERFKIALQIVGLALLIAPPVFTLGGIVGQYELGELCLLVSAAMALATLADYAGRARRAFRQG
jgi:CDP-diacylglycerol--glycerol-3-phosphate 3-phosphatidyltransferase